MVDRLHFTDSDAANVLLVREPLALLIGFALDQQVTVQKAFMGPLVLHERAGTLDAAELAALDLEPIFRERPAIHRFPGAMAGRVHDLVVHVAAEYDGDAARVWTDAISLGAVLARRVDVVLAEPLVPAHPTLGDVDSPEALAEYQAGKRAHKAALRAAAGWRGLRRGAGRAAAGGAGP